MRQESVSHSGSKRLRDSSVIGLGLLPLLLLALIWPLPVLGGAGAWLILFITPLPRRFLRRYEGAAARPGPDAAQVAVLGGGFAGPGALSARSLRRLQQGVALGQGRALWLCGGVTLGGSTEAAALARAARDAGLAEERLHLEDRSRTSFENLLALRDLPGVTLLVSCPHHVPRLTRLARELGLRAVAVGYPVAWLPRGTGGALRLAAECFYEVAVHVFLSALLLGARLGLGRPLRDATREHLR